MKRGLTPPIASRLTTASLTPVEFAVDSHGNALGGVRSPQVDAPVATLTGVNAGAGFCRLFGSTTPFTAAEVTALYPTHAKFVGAWRRAANAAKKAGFLLALDARELKLAAARSSIGG